MDAMSSKTMISYFTALHLILYNVSYSLKLRTVHLGDNTKIYESNIYVQNVFP
jgi:hypothetical protein